MRAAMLSLFLGWVCCTAVLGEDTFPTELHPSNATISSKNGTTDPGTGLPYIPTNASPLSTPPLAIQIDRRFYREALILEDPNQGRVVQTNTLRIGVFPMDYTLNGTQSRFEGATDVGDGTLTEGDDTYYVYIDNAGALQVVTDATGWPEDLTQFVPLAEVDVADAAITAIRSRRGWARNFIPQSGGSLATGVDGTTFTIDNDNGSAGVSSEVRFNRGSTDDDAALRWNETSDLFSFYLDTVNNEFAPISALTLTSTVSTGTAPLTVSSTTLVSNLNADAVDGLDFAAPAAANGIAYSTATDAVDFTAASTEGDVLIAGTSGVPEWAALGSASGVQAHDADLGALAAVSSSGLLARTGAGTAAARTITAGASITVTNGDGVSGNPTIAVSGIAENAVALGTSAGALTSSSVGTDNTVFVGRTGNTPTFRKLLNSDIDATAAIEPSKLALTTPGRVLVANGDGQIVPQTITGDVTFSQTGVTTIGADAVEAAMLAADVRIPLRSTGITAGAEAGNVVTVTITVTDATGAPTTTPAVVDVILSDSQQAVDLTDTAATSITVGGGAGQVILQEVTAGKVLRAVTDPAGALELDIEYTGGAQTWYVWAIGPGAGTVAEVTFE